MMAGVRSWVREMALVLAGVLCLVGNIGYPVLAAPAVDSVTPDIAARDSAVRETVSQANAAARVEPSVVGYVNAMQIWPYSPASLYQVYTRPGRITDISLQPGEQLVDISAPDTVRWMVGNTTSGERENERVHVSVKPTRADLQTNLIVYTNRRTYYLEVTATPATWMAAVAWEYPQEKVAAAKAMADRDRADVNPGGVALERLNFRYEITGARVPWRPVRVFDDGEKVYVQFPSDIGQHDLPPLFIVGAKGTLQLVNYRVQPPYYVVDRLFDVAELRLGEKSASAVRIARGGLLK